jgi:hypothetical protein
MLAGTDLSAWSLKRAKILLALASSFTLLFLLGSALPDAMDRGVDNDLLVFAIPPGLLVVVALVEFVYLVLGKNEPTARDRRTQPDGLITSTHMM